MLVLMALVGIFKSLKDIISGMFTFIVAVWELSSLICFVGGTKH